MRSAVIAVVFAALVILLTEAKPASDALLPIACKLIGCVESKYCSSYTDANGCTACSCPCQPNPCPDSYTCQVVNVNCVREPCPPQAECVPIQTPIKPVKPICPAVLCAQECVAYTDTDECHTKPCGCPCQCQPVICPAVFCTQNCVTYADTDKCHTDPCGCPCQCQPNIYPVA